MERPSEVILIGDLTRTAVSEQPTDRAAIPVTDASLIYIYPKAPQIGRRYSLGADAVTIGRATDCLASIPDTSVSRYHAKIELGPDGQHHVSDLGSTNGTYVNNTRMPTSPLRDGDYLRTGNCIFRYLAGGNVEAEYHEEIYRLTVMDPLTGVHNRRYLTEVLNREVARCVRYLRPLSLVMFDIDRFKAINDRLGHVAGDLALRELASCVGKLIRSDEVFARYGGEEFAVVLAETDRERAAIFGERVRAAVESHQFSFEGQSYPVTVSVGIATTDGADLKTPDDLTQRADERLYEAKRAGRNRVMS